MTASNYDACLKQVLKYEGGYSNHPSDPGGPTNFGITIHDYRRYINKSGTAEDVRRMPLSVAKEIYRTRYWNKVEGDKLFDGVDLAVFDYGVNSGIGRALPDFKPYRDLPPVAAIKALCARRMRFLRALRTWSTFGRGWGPRVANVEAIGVKMALTAQKLPPKEVQRKLEIEAKKAGEAKQGGAVVGGGGTSMAGGTAVKAGVFSQLDWLSVSIGAIVFVAAVFVVYRVVVNYRRQKAYLDAAKAA